MPEIDYAALATRGDEIDPFQIRVYRGDRLWIDRAWDVQNVYDDYWRLYINTTAGAAVWGPFGRHAITPGHVHLIPAWTRFDCHCTRRTRHLYLHFDVPGLPPAVVRDVLAGPVALPLDGLTRAAGKQLGAHLARRPDERWQAALLGRSLISLSLAAWMRALRDGRVAQLQAALVGPNAFAPAMRYIQTHTDTRIDNAALAKLCHMSEGHFIRSFRDAVGQTPQRYALERRLSVAAQLLLDTPDTIEAIAEQTGFTDRAHLTRAFTKFIGQPPAAYRNAGRV